MNDAIGEVGGYLSLDFPDFGDPFPTALKFQSARAGLRYLVELTKTKHVFLPIFICNAVVKAVSDAKAQIHFYSLDESLYPTSLPSIRSDTLLLYVNYFALNDHNIARLLQDFNPGTLLIDNSQALFAAATNAQATIYSPRKFLALPDGGLLVAPSLNMSELEKNDIGSIDRLRHLLVRSAYGANAGYPDFLLAEHSLEETCPLSMSLLTRRLLRSFDLLMIKNRRQENFKTFATILDSINAYSWLLDSSSIPLCYPLVLPGRDIQHLKQDLIRRNVFIPTYWDEVRSRYSSGSIEMQLVDETLYLPIDHRIDTSQVTAIASHILRFLEVCCD